MIEQTERISLEAEGPRITIREQRWSSFAIGREAPAGQLADYQRAPRERSIARLLGVALDDHRPTGRPSANDRRIAHRRRDADNPWARQLLSEHRTMRADMEA